MLPQQYQQLPDEVLLPGLVDQLVQQTVLSQAIDEISSSFDETESMVRATSDAANQAHEVANSASQTATEGSETMANLLSAMDGIDEGAEYLEMMAGALDKLTTKAAGE